VLDEGRREAFLSTLQVLRDEQKHAAELEADLQRERESQLEREKLEAQKRAEEEAIAEKARVERRRIEDAPATSTHKRTSSEIDYGIESTNPRPTSRAESAKGGRKMVSKTGQSSSSRLPISPRSAGAASKRTSTSSSLYQRTALIFSNVQKLILSLTQSATNSPMALIRTLMMIAAVLLVLGRKGVRERVRRVIDNSFQKVRQTVGMGVKVSYI
jgi:hypothetical protein